MKRFWVVLLGLALLAGLVFSTISCSSTDSDDGHKESGGSCH